MKWLTYDVLNYVHQWTTNSRYCNGTGLFPSCMQWWGLSPFLIFASEKHQSRALTASSDTKKTHRKLYSDHAKLNKRRVTTDSPKLKGHNFIEISVGWWIPVSPQHSATCSSLAKALHWGSVSSLRQQVAGWEESATRWTREGLDWILGIISWLKGWSGIEIGCPGKSWNPHLWWSIQKLCGCGSCGYGLLVNSVVLG